MINKQELSCPFNPEILSQTADPKRSRNRRTEEIWSKLEARGDIDPAEYLSSLVTNKEHPADLRAQAANYLLPYKYSKKGTAPVARFVEEAIEVLTFKPSKKPKISLPHFRSGPDDQEWRKVRRCP
jgi:hypothetical protein